ncbi:MAG: hypothetical protein KC432_01240 [Thermomicrobiales bacterium]|nr:hypothetical protein [Thermomicrobiales bacterium]
MNADRLTLKNRYPNPSRPAYCAGEAYCGAGRTSGFLRLPGRCEAEPGVRDLPPGAHEFASPEPPDAEPQRLLIGEVGK